jgi:hypothetical protein
MKRGMPPCTSKLSYSAHCVSLILDVYPCTPLYYGTGQESIMFIHIYEDMSTIVHYLREDGNKKWSDTFFSQFRGQLHHP